MARKMRSGQRQRGAGWPQGATGKAGRRGPRGQRGPAGQATIRRAEFDAAVGSINDNIRGLQVQLRRIADMQAELDEVKRAVARRSEKPSSEIVQRRSTEGDYRLRVFSVSRAS